MYVGVDYHKRYGVATVMDKRGRIVREERFMNTAPGIHAFVKRLPKGSRMALEATGNWYYFYEQVEGVGVTVQLAHPLKTRAIAEAKIKTDKVDATMLAHLLRSDLLPAAYIPPREIRDMREQLRYRAALVSLRTSLKNRIHAVLSKNGIQLEWTNVLGKKAGRDLDRMEVRPCYRTELDGYREVAQALSEQIEQVSGQIQAQVESTPLAQLLTTIPGISHYSALLIYSEIGDIHRFPSARKLCSYAGLVPRVHASGGKIHIGALTKTGSRWLRWILIELTPHFVRGSKRLKRLFDRIRKRHGTATARVAVAREMLKIIFYVLRDERSFRTD